MELRGLYAAAHNLSVEYDRARHGESDGLTRFHEKMTELRDAVALVSPMVESHFAAVRPDRPAGNPL